MLVGIIQQLCAYYVPYLSEVSIGIAMFLVLIMKPEGLLGKVIE
jgi:branched-subunit amino acid ABC-type transport system permease component